MILVLLGTQNKPFSRILKKIERLKKENKKVKYVDSLVNEKEEDYMPVVKLKSWK